MKKLKHIISYKNTIYTTSLTSAFIIVFIVISPAIASVKKGMDLHANCVNTIFPDNVEREIAINSDENVIIVSYEEKNVLKEVVLGLKNDPKFSECSESVQELITVAQNTTDKIHSDTCKELHEISLGIAPIPEMDGKKMDMVAVDNYLKNRCK